MVSSDEEIKQRVVSELFWDSRIDASKVSVTVHDGVVTLEGEVPNYSVATLVLAAPWYVDGVKDVLGSLTIKYTSPPEIPNDEKIKRRIIDILGWEPSVDAGLITVTVENGEVTLEGSVDAFWKRSWSKTN